MGCPTGYVQRGDGILIDRRAFLILGGEGTGTYMMRDVLVNAGCSWDSRFDSFEYDWQDLMRMKDLFVFRRSIPHADEWPEVGKIIRDLKKASYDPVFVIWMVREMHAACMSVKRRRKEATGAELIYNYLASFPLQQNIPNWPTLTENFAQISYDYFVTWGPYRRWLFKYRFKLPYPENYLFFDGNRKYFEEFQDFKDD
jgi:hypothetical protein